MQIRADLETIKKYLDLSAITFKFLLASHPQKRLLQGSSFYMRSVLSSTQLLITERKRKNNIHTNITQFSETISKAYVNLQL